MPETDRIEGSVEATHMGTSPIHFDDWFTPSLNATTPVHPYCADL